MSRHCRLRGRATARFQTRTTEIQSPWLLNALLCSLHKPTLQNGFSAITEDAYFCKTQEKDRLLIYKQMLFITLYEKFAGIHLKKMPLR